MVDSAPSLKETSDRIRVFFIFSLFAISFWTYVYYNISTIIEILVKNIWIVGFLFIINCIIPSIFVYFIANSLNENVSFLRSLGASLLSNIVLGLISFALFLYMNQILAILILPIILLIVFIIIYAYIFHVNWIDAFKIASTYAFISIVIISISIVYVIIFNLG